MASRLWASGPLPRSRQVMVTVDIATPMYLSVKTALLGASTFYLTAIRFIVLISLKRSTRSSEKSSTGMSRIALEVLQLHLPRARNQSPVSYKNQAFWKHPPCDCHWSPGSRNCRQLPGFRKNLWTQSSPTAIMTPAPSWHAP